jgi:thiol-disulfide isomerase/thioredoxin
MKAYPKRRWLLWAAVFVAGLVVAGGTAARFGLLRLGANAEGELGEIRAEWRQAIEARFDARRAAKSAAERQAADDEFAARQRQLVERSQNYSRAHAGTPDELRALKMVACRVPESSEGRQALETLASRCATDNFALLVVGLDSSAGISGAPVQRLAGILLERVRKAPDDPQAALLLASVICPLTLEGLQTRTPPADFQAAADLIMERYADRPGIQNFSEVVGFHVARSSWGGGFEKHLRAILARNHDRQVRAATSFALASLVQAAGESRQLEAQQLYQDFVDQYDGSVKYTEDGQWYGYFSVEQQLNQAARKQIAELSERGLGKPAAEIVGVDLDGAPMKLSDFRGKVVLLSFWATSCGPCLKFVPHEQAVLERFESQSFAIVGVDGEDDFELARKTARERGITWRSFRDNLGPGRTITTDWKNTALPMLYLIDRQGIIRRRWVGAPLQEDLNDAVAKLCAAPP